MSWGAHHARTRDHLVPCAGWLWPEQPFLFLCVSLLIDCSPESNLSVLGTPDEQGPSSPLPWEHEPRQAMGSVAQLV